LPEHLDGGYFTRVAKVDYDYDFARAE